MQRLCKLLKIWSGRRESNSQPTAWKAVTLPLSYSRLRSRSPHSSCPLELRRGKPASLRTVPAFENDKPPCPAEARSRHDRAKADGEGRIRTFEGAGPTDLQSAAFDRFATSPDSRRSATEHAPPLSTRPMTCQGFAPFCEFLSVDSWSWRRDLNPRPADYKSAALPD